MHRHPTFKKINPNPGEVMYFQKATIENTGPIGLLQLDFPFNNNTPLPVIVVGENGTGKTILLSHLVNSLVIGKTYHYDDSVFVCSQN
jgi:ABC-type cobalamin/Fe3+-siderophores transport system ATPase subunit